MAETLLARQLKKLAVPQTSLLLQDKIRPSLLFDPREASGIDRDTAYAIGLTGLEELETIGSSFSQFHDNLFSESAKYTERSVQDKEGNEKLDRHIDKFLTLLSPYFLLQASHKAMEWLIYRFHIHMFNVNALIATILPFHESRVFVRVLQLIDLNDPSGQWHWLQPLQKNGMPLPKSTLITHCYKDLSFMRFVCDLVPRILQEHSASDKAVCHTPISFYTIVIMGALESADNITENMVSALLPYFSLGLRSSSVDFVTSTYMIICQLAKKIPFKDFLIQKLLTKIILNTKKKIADECVLCLLVVCHHQKISKLSKSTVLGFGRKPFLVKTLMLVANRYEIAEIILSLLSGLLPSTMRGVATGKDVKRVKGRKGWTNKHLLMYIVTKLVLSGKAVNLIVRTSLKFFLKYRKLSRKEPQCYSSSSVQKLVKQILEKLENRYPDNYDVAIERTMKKLKPVKKQILQKMINSCPALGTKHRVLAKSNTTLFLSVNSPSVARRIMGIETLVSMLQSETSLNDLGFVCDCLLQRLLDDDAHVVECVLKLQEKLLVILPKTELFATLFQVLRKDSSKHYQKWLQVKMSIIELLLSCTEEISDQLREDIYPLMISYLLPLKPAAMKGVRLILTSHLSKVDSLLSVVSSELSEKLLKSPETEMTEEQLNDIASAITQSFSKAIGSAENDIQSKIMRSLMEAAENESSWNTVTLVFILLNVITVQLETGKCTDEVVSLVIKLSLKWLSKSLILEDENGWRFCLRKGSLPFHILVKCLRNVVEFSASNVVSDKIRCDLFAHLTECASAINKKMALHYRDLLGLFLKVHFKDTESRIAFLSSFWVESNQAMQVRSLYMSSAVFACSDCSFFQEGSEEVVRLLSCLISPEDIVREATFKCVNSALEQTSQKDSPFGELFAFLLEHSEEIQVDKNQLPQLLSTWLSKSLSEQAISSGVRTRSQAFKTNVQCIVLNSLLDFCKNSSLSVQLRHDVLVMLENCTSEFILSELLVVINEEIKNCENVGKVSPLSASILHLLFSHYNVTTALSLLDCKTPTYATLERAFRCHIKGDATRDNVQQIAMKAISKKVFLAIPSKDVQFEILDLILDMYVECENSAVAEQQFKTLKKLSCDSEIIAKQLHLSDGQVSKQTVKEVRQSRLLESEQNDDAVSILEKIEWKKIIAILEILQAKEDLSNAEVLVPVLFDLLNRSLEMESVPQLEYLRQLLLTCLSTCLVQSADSKLQEQQIKVELAIQCIRISANPHTQQLALALLNTAAVFFPEHVLHNIMAIFTFMGTSLMRQDDSYSFQMTLKTVDTIVPALLKASLHQAEKTDSEDAIADVTRVFVDAFSDVPQHRRVPLFSRLISTLGPSEFLWLPLCQLFGSIVTKSKQDHKEHSSVTQSEELEFAIALCHSFRVSVQVKACLSIIKQISLLPNQKSDEISASESLQVFGKVFNVQQHSEKQLRHFKYVAVSFLSLLLSSETFIGQVADLKEKASSRMELLFQKILERTLQYIQDVAQQIQMGIQTHSGKFWKSLLHKLYELLDKVNSLLPGQQFVAVVQGLIHHPLPSVRRKAVEMLNSKLLHQQEFFRPEDSLLLLDLIKPLTKMAKGKKIESVSVEEIILNQQTALFALKLLCKSIGSSSPEVFQKVLDRVVKLLKRSHGAEQQQLTASALLCLAELCNSLKENCIPFLNDFMHPVVEILRDHETLESNELLLLSVMITVHRLVENLSPFLSSFMAILVTEVCLLKMGYEEGKETSNAIQQRLQAVSGHLASSVPLRVFLPAVKDSYDSLYEKSTTKMAIGPLMSLVGDKMLAVDKEELGEHLLEVQDFFLLVLDFRNNWKKGSLDCVQKVETTIVLALQALVLKLSEISFRPFFYKIFDWATRDEDEKDKLLTFYSLTEVLAQKLKSIFVLFASHFVGNAAHLLDSLNDSKTEDVFFGSSRKSQQKSCHLLDGILSTLRHCFLYDNQHLVNKESFAVLMQPLVDQIENMAGGDEIYKERIEHRVSPCLAQLAVAASDDLCWKPLNYQILLKMRHSSAVVRFAALQVIREVVVKLGENYMSLLPESIPFLAELMEDESIEVEQQCQKVVGEMEQILGESLTKYF